jgi:hypothetical protein
MTKTFATNANNDLYIGSDGNLVVLTGLQAVRDACSTAAKAQLGEMVLDINRGIPNFQTVWVGAPNIPQFETALRNTLQAVADVVEVVSLTTSITKGTLNYTAVILTTYGQTFISGLLNGFT